MPSREYEGERVMSELYRQEISETLGALRDELRSMNQRLQTIEGRAERAPRSDEHTAREARARSLSDAKRVRQDVDELMRRYEMASLGGGVAYRSRREIPGADGSASWIKRMMMLMMIAELS